MKLPDLKMIRQYRVGLNTHTLFYHTPVFRGSVNKDTMPRALDCISTTAT
ncbi:MAG: hypothetical protein KKD44_13395 [Proteobacteria bacterium]|nr:hypothetical protein [Pseudomonadota bacterium]